MSARPALGAAIALALGVGVYLLAQIPAVYAVVGVILLAAVVPVVARDEW